MIALAGLVAMGAAGVCTAWRARRQRDHRPAAVLLLAGLVNELVRELLGRWVLRPERARLLDLVGGVEELRPPFSGVVRDVFHLDQALLWAWPAGVAVVVWWAMRRRDGRTALLQHALLLAAFVTVLAGRYPELRGAALGSVYRWATVACIGSALVAVAMKVERFGRVQLVALLLVAGECATLAGPYLGDPFGLWWLAQATWVLPFALICVVTTRGRSPWRIALV